MENRIYVNSLYDYYASLLTKRQKLYFEEYYFNNLSLAEISDNYNISRSAIHKQLKDTELKLDYYEENLKLYQKGIKIKELIKELDQKTVEKIIDLI